MSSPECSSLDVNQQVRTRTLKSVWCLTPLGFLGCLFILVELHHQVLLFSLHVCLLLLDGRPPLLLILQLFPAEHTDREASSQLHFGSSVPLKPSWRRAWCFKLLGPVPLPLLLQPLLFGLRLHLLNLDGVWLATVRVELMVSHAQLQDGLVDPQSWGVEYEVLGKKEPTRY